MKGQQRPLNRRNRSLLDSVIDQARSDWSHRFGLGKHTRARHKVALRTRYRDIARLQDSHLKCCKLFTIRATGHEQGKPNKEIYKMAPGLSQGPQASSSTLLAGQDQEKVLECCFGSCLEHGISSELWPAVSEAGPWLLAVSGLQNARGLKVGEIKNSKSVGSLERHFWLADGNKERSHKWNYNVDEFQDIHIPKHVEANFSGVSYEISVASYRKDQLAGQSEHLDLHHGKENARLSHKVYKVRNNTSDSSRRIQYPVLTPIAEAKSSSRLGTPESASLEVSSKVARKVNAPRGLLRYTKSKRMTFKSGDGHPAKSPKTADMEDNNVDLPKNDRELPQHRVTFQVESDFDEEEGVGASDTIGDGHGNAGLASTENETEFPADSDEHTHFKFPSIDSSQRIAARSNGRQRKVGRVGDQVSGFAKPLNGLLKRITPITLSSTAQTSVRRYSTGVISKSLQTDGVIGRSANTDKDIGLERSQNNHVSSKKDSFPERSQIFLERRYSNSSKQAVYGTSKASISNMSEKYGVLGLGCENCEENGDLSFALLGRRSSLTSKIKAWRTMYPERPSQDCTVVPGVRHSASLPALMSYQQKSNQRQHLQQPQPQQQQQQQQQQRRHWRRSSITQSQNNGILTTYRTGRRNPDSYAMTGAGLRKLLRKTLSQGDFTKMSALKNFMPLVKFRRAVKMILLLQRATYNSRERNQRRERHHSLWASVLGGNFTTSKRAYEMYGISFDPQDFKANREIQVSAEAKAILSLDPSQRTPHQLRLVLMSLRQAVKEFSEFPITMQESLARVGWYEHFEAKRVIIRQGHTAENFYFILSGTAVVIVLDSDKLTGEQNPRTAAFLGKGKSFGELALMHKSRRTATVTCRDDVELLAVGREDFIDIFMHVERDIEPEHVRFLRSLHILRDWPIEVLPVDNPQVLLFTYVRRGVLLCKDSNSSEWIFIVKSGYCDVIKGLRASHAQIDRKSFSSSVGGLSQLASASITFPLLSPLPNIGSKENRENRKEIVKVKQRKSIKSGSCASMTLTRDASEIEKAELEHMQTLDAIMEKRHALHNQEDSEDQSENVSRRTSVYHHRDSKSAIASTVFVQVLKLVPRDIYGLESCVFKSMNKTTSTSLVSGGAELIMINRKFFLDHTSEQLRKQIRREIRPLPSEETLQAKLETMVSWEAYRHVILKNAVDSRRRHASVDLS